MKISEYNRIRNCAIDLVKNFEEGIYRLKGVNIGAGVWEIVKETNDS